MITDINQLDFNKKYTYADYLTWQFKERVELIKGRLFRMSPAPNVKHQRIVTDITIALGVFLRGNDCQVFTAPFDVRLPNLDKNNSQKYTVVQPDVTVICDASKLDEQGCNGAPDLVVEVLSPGNTAKEMNDKFEVYQNAGVQEYWLVDPEREHIIIYSLNKKGEYVGSRPYVTGKKVESEVLPGFVLDTNDIFSLKEGEK